MDYARRAELLDGIEREWAAGGESRARFLRDIALAPEDGRLKLHLIRAALAARRRRPRAFESTVYLPLAANGPAADRVVALGRGEGKERLIAAVPRLIGAQVMAAGTAPTDPALWGSDVLPIPHDWPMRWTSALTAEPIVAEAGGFPLATLFGVLPAALLLADETSS